MNSVKMDFAWYLVVSWMNRGGGGCAETRRREAGRWDGKILQG